MNLIHEFIHLDAYLDQSIVAVVGDLYGLVVSRFKCIDVLVTVDGGVGDVNEESYLQLDNQYLFRESTNEALLLKTKFIELTISEELGLKDALT